MEGGAIPKNKLIAIAIVIIIMIIIIVIVVVIYMKQEKDQQIASVEPSSIPPPPAPTKTEEVPVKPPTEAPGVQEPSPVEIEQQKQELKKELSAQVQAQKEIIQKQEPPVTLVEKSQAILAANAIEQQAESKPVTAPMTSVAKMLLPSSIAPHPTLPSSAIPNDGINRDKLSMSKMTLETTQTDIPPPAPISQPSPPPPKPVYVPKKRQIVAGSYVFHPGMDSTGYDLETRADLAGNLKALFAYCDRNPECYGFNTSGVIKRRIKPPSEFSLVTINPAEGLYERVKF